jgi:hypothetical protein
LDEAGRIGTGVGVAAEDVGQSVRLVFSRDEEIHGQRRVYDRDGQRDAGGFELEHGVRDYPAVVDLERRGLGEEARGVTVAAYAK